MQLMKILQKLLLWITLTLATSCLNIAVLPPTATSTPVIPSTTIAILSPSPTISSSTPRQSHIANAHFLTNCLSINQVLSPNQILDGLVIFDNRAVINGEIASGVVALNLENQEKKQIQKEGERLLDFKESPDRTRVAYELAKHEQNGFVSFLVISTSDFKIEETIPWKKEWDRLLGWTDNTHIIFRKVERNVTLKNPKEIPPELIIFDTSTLEEKILKPDFPDVYDSPNLPYWDGFGTVIYSPNLTRTVYMGWKDSTQSTYTYVLWDMKSQQSLAIQSVVGYPIPKWSPDGTQFITTGLIDHNFRELFSISKDGKIDQLTYLSNYSSKIEIVSYSWSLNSQYIALLLVKQNDPKMATVAVLDITTGIITDYCVPITREGDGYSNGFTPIWSPNSKQMIVQDWYSRDHRREILIDIVENYAIKIAEELEPLAWLKQP